MLQFKFGRPVYQKIILFQLNNVGCFSVWKKKIISFNFFLNSFVERFVNAIYALSSYPISAAKPVLLLFDSTLPHFLVRKKFGQQFPVFPQKMSSTMQRWQGSNSEDNLDIFYNCISLLRQWVNVWLHTNIYQGVKKLSVIKLTVWVRNLSFTASCPFSVL